MAVLNRFCAGLKAKRDTPARKGKEGGLDPLPSFPTGAIVELLCVASTLIFCFLFVSGGERTRPTLLGLTILGKGNMERRPGRSRLYFIAPCILEHPNALGGPFNCEG